MEDWSQLSSRALPICLECGPWKMPPRCTFKEGGVVPAAELLAQGQLILRQIQVDVSLGHFSPIQDHSDGPFWFNFALCTVPLSSLLINFPVGEMQ